MIDSKISLFLPLSSGEGAGGRGRNVNRDKESYLNIIEKLKAQDESGRVIAEEMEKRIKVRFPEE